MWSKVKSESHSESWEDGTEYGRAGNRSDVTVNNFRVELPPPFRGDGQRPFATWIKQFEAAVRAQTRGASTAVYMDTLSNILPTRLDGAAFLLWDSLPGSVQLDYERVKEKLKDAFGMKQYLLFFQTCVNARPRQENESLEVYAADISRLVAEAFPDYDWAAQNGEKFRRFLAGLDPALQAKCHEQGATDMDEALIIASRCERARQSVLGAGIAPASPYKLPNPAVVANLGSPPPAVMDCNANAAEKLVHAVERLTLKVDSLQSEVRELKTRGPRPEEGRRGSMAREDWRQDTGERGGQRGACHCDCGRSGCRSAVGSPQRDDHARGRSPRREPQRGYNAREWSPRERGARVDFSPRRSDDWERRERRAPEDQQQRRGVRFLSPSRRSPSPALRGQQQGNFD